MPAGASKLMFLADIRYWNKLITDWMLDAGWDGAFINMNDCQGPQDLGFTSGSETVTYHGHTYTHVNKSITQFDAPVQQIVDAGLKVVLGLALNTYWPTWLAAPPDWLPTGTGHWPVGTGIGSPAVRRSTTKQMYEDIWGPTFDALDADTRISGYGWEHGYDQFFDWITDGTVRPKTPKRLRLGTFWFQGNPLSKWMWVFYEHSFNHRYEVMNAHPYGADISYEFWYGNEVPNVVALGNYLHDNYPNIRYGVQGFYGVGVSEWGYTWSQYGEATLRNSIYQAAKYYRQIKNELGRPFDFQELLPFLPWQWDITYNTDGSVKTPQFKPVGGISFYEQMMLLNDTNLLATGEKPSRTVIQHGVDPRFQKASGGISTDRTDTFDNTGKEYLVFKNVGSEEYSGYEITVTGGATEVYDPVIPAGRCFYAGPYSRTNWSANPVITYDNTNLKMSVIRLLSG